MPQASQELRTKWNGPDEDTAMGHLNLAGLYLTNGWQWQVPQGYKLTDDDWSAISFLVEEWDFGGAIFACREDAALNSIEPDRAHYYRKDDR